MKTYFLDLTTVSDGELEQWYHQMPRLRQERCKRIKKELSQKQCIAADRLMRSALSEYLNIPMDAVEIQLSAEGKPYLQGDPVRFSISHSDNLIACVVSEDPVGIDVERIRPIPEEAQKRICTPAEWEYLCGASDDRERELRFISLWTRKEAVFKIEGHLPRRDKETDVMEDTENLTIRTEVTENYIVTTAKKML